MSECRCDFRGKILGDGCYVCNPAKALEYALETIADQTAELDTLRAQLAAAEARAERLSAALMLGHIWQGNCPESGTPDSRDTECPACIALGAPK